VPGYAVVNLNARLRINARLEIFALVDNLLDKRYASFGVLAENLFVGPNRTFGQGARVAEQFRGLGAPRGAWLGVRFSW
jgi:outer membrane receptor protein involved in Fe transport